MNEQQAPVKVGETFEVTINAVGEKGDGIARLKRFVLFFTGTKKGESVKIKVTKVLAKVGFAEVVGKAEPRSERPRFATFSKEELTAPPVEEDHYHATEDTEDF